MKILESQLRKIIQTQLREFRFPEKDISVSTDTNISKILDQALAGKHVSGRPFPSWLKNSINENSEIESMNEESLLRIVSELKKMMFTKGLEIETLTYDNGKKIPSPYLEVLKSILLFTGGSVETVRSPSKYRASFAKDMETFGDYTLNYGDVKTFIPTKFDYQLAKNVLTKLALAKNNQMNSTLYRGITLPEEKIDLLKPGITFNNMTISSWTTDEGIANDFAFQGDFNPVLLTVKNPQFGCEIGKISAFPREEESILGKKLKIVDIITDTNVDLTTINCEVIP